MQRRLLVLFVVTLYALTVWSARADDSVVAGLFAGTQGGGQGGGGKVFHYVGNSQWAEISPDTVWDASDA